MDPIDYCAAKAAPEGSPGYYTVLFQPPPARAGLLALLALERELQDVVEDCSEPAVAAHKLAFWREQLAGALEDNASHPVGIALARSAPAALDAALLERLLVGVNERIGLAQVRDGAELDRSCLATAGQVGEAMLRVAHGNSGRDDGAAVAVAVERVRLLRLPRRAGRPPHSGVPMDLLTRAGATPAQIDSGSAEAGARALRRALLDEAHARLDDAASGLRSARGLLATRLRIARSELAALERSGYEDNGAARAALPLALLWAAWRSRPPGGRGR